MIRKNNYYKNNKKDSNDLVNLDNINRIKNRKKSTSTNTRISAKRIVWFLLVIILIFVLLIR